jgi:hypothetical protein
MKSITESQCRSFADMQEDQNLRLHMVRARRLNVDRLPEATHTIGAHQRQPLQPKRPLVPTPYAN